MAIPIYNPQGPKIKAPRKPRTKTGPYGPNKITGNDMLKQMEIFKERTSSNFGITSDENIELFYKISQTKVLALSYRDRAKKWNHIKSINKILKNNGWAAIIFEPLRKGEVLYNPPALVPQSDAEVWKDRRLTRDTNSYFRCVSKKDALRYQAIMDKIAKGVIKTMDDTDSISEREENEAKQREEEKEVIQQLKQVIPIKIKNKGKT